MINFNSQIKKEMQRRKMTIMQLTAELIRLGTPIAQSSLYSYINGNLNPSAATAEKILNALGGRLVFPASDDGWGKSKSYSKPTLVYTNQGLAVISPAKKTKKK